MIPEKILTIHLGANAVYLLSGRHGYLLIDGGFRLWDRLFFIWLKKAGINPEKIRLVVVTHAHFDHAGTLRAVVDRCRCPVAAHPAEARLLASGKVVIPPGTNRMAKRVKAFTRRHPDLTTRVCSFRSVEPDILISREQSLARLGFDASIIPTPGHTEGSLTVLTDAGNAFVGDIAVNMPLLGAQRYASPFGYSPDEMASSLQTLILAGAKRIYPAHGRPFDAAEWLRKIPL